MDTLSCAVNDLHSLRETSILETLYNPVKVLSLKVGLAPFELAQRPRFPLSFWLASASSWNKSSHDGEALAFV